MPGAVDPGRLVELALGMVRMYCRIRKMKKALPKNAGTMSGRYVPYQPIDENIRNCGTISACHGISMVRISSWNSRSRQRNRSRANA